MCLLIGPSGVGKTMMLKRLQSHNFLLKGAAESLGEVPATIPTVGTNLVNILTGKRQEVTLRELGGSMGPIWHNYFKDTDAIIYMIDLSNRFQVSASCIQLLMVLSHSQTKNLPVMLLLNKGDLGTVMSRSELESLFQLEHILKHSSQKIAMCEISAKTGRGLDSVVRWILDNHKAGPSVS